jgi:MFS family permease
MFLATTGLVWAVSAGIGPLLGGVFTQYSNWRWVFWINLPCCFVAFVVLYMFLNTTHNTPAASLREGRKMDWIGTAAIVSMTVLTLLSLDLGGVIFPWNSPKVLSILVSGLVLCVVFVLWEAKGAADPLIPARILDSISKASPLFVCFTHGIVSLHIPAAMAKGRKFTSLTRPFRSTFHRGTSSLSTFKLFAELLPCDQARF